MGMLSLIECHTDNLKRFLTQNENLTLLKTYVNKALFFFQI